MNHDTYQAPECTAVSVQTESMLCSSTDGDHEGFDPLSVANMLNLEDPFYGLL